ncbi:SMP-30/gluconolactonase/LRE family protein [Pseudoduganella sp. RAF19]|uniref:SMP-30/gluconolactonase/LRE family protein n=1 Tax=Pseudoduganella sp. RAF19 TaxID=3233052 RepID=UPI003F99366A
MQRHIPALIAIAAATMLPVTAFAAACGKAPSGELTAQRIAAVTPTRNEPGLYEGPVWIGDALYFSDFAFSQGFPSRIRKLAADGSVSTVTDDSGSNGLAVDAAGKLIVASHKDKAVLRQSSDGKRTVIAQRYEGNVFNSPNDIALTTDGTLYFTDPDYQKTAAPGGQPVTGIYRVGTDGKVTLVDGTRHNPNGIALSLKEDILYVNASDDEVRAYPIKNGVPQSARHFARIEGGDGMTLDCHGNLYVTEHGARRVRVFDPQGEVLATIRVDANVTNVAFGGKEGKTLYITGAGAVWQLPLDVTGRPY